MAVGFLVERVNDPDGIWNLELGILKTQSYTAQLREARVPLRARPLEIFVLVGRFFSTGSPCSINLDRSITQESSPTDKRLGRSCQTQSHYFDRLIKLSVPSSSWPSHNITIRLLFSNDAKNKKPQRQRPPTST